MLRILTLLMLALVATALAPGAASASLEESAMVGWCEGLVDVNCVYCAYDSDPRHGVPYYYCTTGTPGTDRHLCDVWAANTCLV